jgi:hypothetical protein
LGKGKKRWLSDLIMVPKVNLSGYRGFYLSQIHSNVGAPCAKT